MADPFESGAARPQKSETLGRAVTALAARGDHRGVVRLVERWGAAGEPSRSALLLQCRALVELRLMDRAWVRLNELIGDAPDDAEALLLAAEMFVERGWPARGRKLLDRVPEDARDERWSSLSGRADAPPLQPASNAREIEESGSPPEQLELAERFQAAGSFLRAKSILERLRRMNGPWGPRVEDLLWALSGDFAKEDGDPLTLAHLLVPSLAEDDAPELTESSAREVTSTLYDLDDETGDDDEEGGPAFPSLFRRLDEPTETETASEVTSVSVMADKEAMRARLLEEEDAEEDDEFVEDLYEDGRSGDTQIMLIMRRGGGGEAAETPDGPAHRRKEEEEGYQLRETLNLRAYQESMGMSPVGGREFSEEVALEEEDDDLIVVTKREKDPAHALTDPPPEPDGPVEVIEKPIGPVAPPAPPPPPAPVSLAERAPQPAARKAIPPAPIIPDVPAPSGERPRSAVDRAPPPRRRPPPQVDEEEGQGSGGAKQLLPLLIMAIVLMLVGLGFVLVLSRVLQAAG